MKVKKIAVVCCTGGSPRTVTGIREASSGAKPEDACAAILAEFPDGVRQCRFGCLGGGSCEAVCPRQAIHVNGDGCAVVEEAACVGCGRCVKTCPQHLIRLFPAYDDIRPLCSNREAGKAAKAVCPDSCIGCGICEKNCPEGAIHVEENRAVIDSETCVNCGMCAVKCPRGAIHDRRGIFAPA